MKPTDEPYATVDRLGQGDDQPPPPPQRLKVVPMTKAPAPWTPVELLREFLAAVESGKEAPVMLAVSWMEKTDDDGLHPRYWNAGCSRAEQIAFLELMKLALIDDWRRP